MVVDHGFERKLLEAVKEDYSLSDSDEKRLVWLQEQEIVLRHGAFEAGVSKDDWRKWR